MTENSNGAGRFLRIEDKLDDLGDSLGAFREDTVTRLTRLETQAEENARAAVRAATVTAASVAARSFSWMKAGIVASFAVGVTAIILRLVGG